MIFYRCTLCSSVVSEWDIRRGACQKCGGVRIMPTNLTWREKLIQIVKHPLVWRWPNNGAILE